jgi:hypothetical protein
MFKIRITKTTKSYQRETHKHTDMITLRLIFLRSKNRKKVKRNSHYTLIKFSEKINKTHCYFIRTITAENKLECRIRVDSGKSYTYRENQLTACTAEHSDEVRIGNLFCCSLDPLMTAKSGAMQCVSLTDFHSREEAYRLARVPIFPTLHSLPIN